MPCPKGDKPFSPIGGGNLSSPLNLTFSTRPLACVDIPCLTDPHKDKKTPVVHKVALTLPLTTDAYSLATSLRSDERPSGRYPENLLVFPLCLPLPSVWESRIFF